MAPTTSQRIRTSLLFFFGLLLPTQLGKHFWPPFAYLHGIRVDYFAPTLYGSDLLLVLLIIMFWRYIVLLLQSWKKWIALLTVFLFLSYCFHGFEQLFLYRVLQYGKIVCVAVVFSQLKKRDIYVFLLGLASSSAYMFIIAALQIQLGGSLQGFWWILGERMYTGATPGISSIGVNGLRIIRPYGTFSHPNTLGGFYLLTSILLYLGEIYWGVVPSVLLVLMSFSRTATIGLAIFLIFISFRSGCRRCKYIKVLIATLLIGVTTLWKGSETSVIERIYTWSYGMRHVFETVLQLPHLGDYLIHQRPLPYMGLLNQPIHNVFLIVFSEWKIAGILIFYVLLKHSARVSFILLFCLVLIGMFDHYLVTQQQTMLLLGVIVGLNMSVRTNLKMPSSLS